MKPFLKMMLRKSLIIKFLPLTILFFLINSCDKENEENEPTATSQLVVSPAALNLSNKESGRFFLSVQPEGEYRWNLSSKPDWVSVNPDSGIIGDELIEIEVMPSPEGLAANTYTGEIELVSNGAGKILVEVEMRIQEASSVDAYVERKWLLGEGEIIDAEYDRNFDRLIAVSVAPNQIRKYDPVSKTSEILDLNLPPTCISVSQDGQYAAVGHDGRISHINLITMQLEDILDVTTDVFDIVLAPNNWVYAFPRADQWETIRCINLETKEETMHTGNSIRERTKVKLHPSGNFIYGANNGLSPSDFEKYDITMGTAQYVYDSPYHGDFSFDGNIWISEDGEKLFARSRNIFNATTSQSTDMTYRGKLIGDQDERIAALDHHEDKNTIYTIFEDGFDWQGNPSSIVKKYTADFFNFQGEEELPKFLGTDSMGNEKLFDSQGYYGFFNASGRKFYVLVKAAEEDNISVRWAIATLSID